MPRPKGRRRKYWGPHQWTPPVTPAGGPNPYKEIEAWLWSLMKSDVILDFSGHAGKYEVTLPSLRVVTLIADTDQAAREAMAILGAER